MRKTFVIATLLGVLLICSCAKQEPLVDESVISDIDKEQESKEETKKEYKNDLVSYYSVLGGAVTFDGERLYYDKYVYNTVSNEKKINCNRPGCTHDDDRCFLNNYKMCRKTCYDGGFLCADGNTLKLIKDDEENVLLKNKKHPKSTENKEINAGDDPDSIYYYVFLDEKTIFAVGRNYGFSYDLEKGVQGEIIEAGQANTYLRMASYGKRGVLLQNADNELFFVDIKNNTAEKLEDHVVGVRVSGEDVYFIQYIEGTRKLYRYDLSNGTKTFIMDDIGYYFYPFEDGSLFFTYEGNYGTLYKANPNGQITAKLIIPGGDEENGFKIMEIYDFSFADDYFIYVDRSGEDEMIYAFIEVDQNLKEIAKYGF